MKGARRLRRPRPFSYGPIGTGLAPLDVARRRQQHIERPQPMERDVYAGFRNANPRAFLERRNRLIGPIFTFSVRGNF
jgi:hypothetical protein